MKTMILILSILFFASCSDAVYNTFNYSSDVPVSVSSASSVSSESSASSVSSVSSQSSQSRYVPSDILIAYQTHLLAGRWDGATFNIALVSSNRHVIQSGCRYSITSPGGIVHDHFTGQSWDSGIREDILTGGIGYFRAGNAILVSAKTGLYSITINGKATKIYDKLYVNFTIQDYRMMRNGPMFAENAAYIPIYNGFALADGTFKQSYELTSPWMSVIFGQLGHPHETTLRTRTIGALNDYKIGEYYKTNVSGFDRAKYLCDNARVYDKYLFANGSTISATNWTYGYKSTCKLALFIESPYVYWYDAKLDYIVKSSYYEPGVFWATTGYFTGTYAPGGCDDATYMAIRVNQAQVNRWRRNMLYVDKNGNLIMKNIQSEDSRVLLNGATNCSISIIANDEIHGER